ncbi:HNH endonuclease signature motif containing protein [Arcobacter sp. YIC-310]|uniref:HNH endonuclease signature motif containing protein n=1 Tax=Arcobacter sp. YIC-310 TaxID=3376632 RepID=UPI003C23271D
MYNNTVENFIKYGIDKSLSLKLETNDLTISKCRNLSKKDLKEKYNLSENEISIVKNAVIRKPIDSDTIDSLLTNSNYICNICKGKKSDSFIVHHIEEYEKTQDNSYDNLIVLCPSDHDLAHKQGLSLTNKITKEQLRKSKLLWEEEVKKHNISKASENINIHEEVVDFVNIQRLEEIVFLTFKEIPNTYASKYLRNKKILNSDGFFDEYYVRNNLSTSSMVFSYISSGEGIHYLELLKEVAKKKNFIDLRDLFKIRSINKQQINGQYVFFTGGFYSRSIEIPVNDTSPLIMFHYKKNKIKIECNISPQYALSMSALARLGKKTLYSIYGVVKNTFKDGDNWVISISPYIIGFPKKHNSSNPFFNHDELEEDLYYKQEDLLVDENFINELLIKPDI